MKWNFPALVPAFVGQKTGDYAAGNLRLWFAQHGVRDLPATIAGGVRQKCFDESRRRLEGVKVRRIAGSSRMRKKVHRTKFKTAMT